VAKWGRQHTGEDVAQRKDAPAHVCRAHRRPIEKRRSEAPFALHGSQQFLSPHRGSEAFAEGES
jgi:hypothetical protein